MISLSLFRNKRFRLNEMSSVFVFHIMLLIFSIMNFLADRPGHLSELEITYILIVFEMNSITDGDWY